MNSNHSRRKFPKTKHNKKYQIKIERIFCDFLIHFFLNTHLHV